MNTLYHASLCLPPHLVNLFGRYESELTNHAKQAQKTDRYGKFEFPKFVKVSSDSIVEVETDSTGTIIKILVRVEYDVKFDLCLAIIPIGKQARIKTGWLNVRSDNHKTLDVTKYYH